MPVVQLRGKLLDQFIKTFVKIKGQRCANTLPTVTSLIGHMSILDECPGESYKLCRKKLHWYRIGDGCPECKKINKREYYKKTREITIKRAKNWKENNRKRVNELARKKRNQNLKTEREKCKNRNIKWREKNREKTRKSCKKWREKNPDKIREKTLQKYTQTRRAIPSWADKTKIQNIYKKALYLSRKNKTKYHVDHIYPLRSNWLCGLHVETNLQIITAKENLKKSNVSWPGQLDCQKGSVYDIFPKELTQLLND